MRYAKGSSDVAGYSRVRRAQREQAGITAADVDRDEEWANVYVNSLVSSETVITFISP